MTDELEEIRTRHEADDKVRQYIGFLDAPTALRAARQAHADRATLLRALDAERARRVEGWQPIETAPRDGTPILACAAGSSFNDASIVKWWKNDWVAMADGHYAILSAGDTWTDWIQPYVTHWQPLPTPPATQHEDTP